MAKPLPLPLECLASPIRDVAADVSRRLCVDPGNFGLVAIAVAGGANGGRIRVKGSDGFHLGTNLSVAVSAPSGTMKSGSVGQAVRPCAKQDELWLDEYTAACEAFEKIHASWATEGKAGDEPKAPVRRRILIGDSTPEKTALLLVDNPNGLICYVDELAMHIDAGGKKGREDQRALDLASFEPSGPFCVDRVGRPSIVVREPRLSIIGTIQPQVLRRLIQGREDGYFERFLLWEPEIPPFVECDDPRDAFAEARYSRAIRRIIDLEPSEVGAQLHESGLFWFMPLDPDGKRLYRAWLNFVEKSVRLPIWRDRSRLASWFGKTRSLVLKVSLITHLLEDGTGAIPAEVLARSITLAVVLLSHAEAVLSDPDVAGLSPEAALAGAILDEALPDYFTARDAKRLHRSGLDGQAVDRALETLVNHGNLYKETEKKNTGRTTNVYHAYSRLSFGTFGTESVLNEVGKLLHDEVISKFAHLGTFNGSTYKGILDIIQIYTSEESLDSQGIEESAPPIAVVENLVPKVPKGPRPASSVQGRIIELLKYAPMGMDELQRKSTFTAFSVESALSALVSEGSVQLTGDVYAIKE